MVPPSPRVLSALSVAAAATFVAGIVSAFSVGSGSGSSTASSAPPASTAAPDTTTAAGQTPASTAAPGTPTSVTAAPAKGGPGTTTTTVPPLPPASGPVGDPGQPTAPRPGTYHYTYAFSGEGSDPPTTGPLTKQITTVSSAGGTTRQTEVDQGPDSRATRNVTDDWRPQGLYEIKELISFNGQNASCTWNPPLNEAPTGLAPGKAWTIQGTCSFSVYGQPFTLKLTGTGKVTGKERLSVGGQGVDVWDVAVHYTMTASNAGLGTYTITFDGTDRFAARLGLVVEEDADTTVSSASSGSHTAHVHEAAQSLNPT